MMNTLKNKLYGRRRKLDSFSTAATQFKQDYTTGIRLDIASWLNGVALATSPLFPSPSPAEQSTYQNATLPPIDSSTASVRPLFLRIHQADLTMRRGWDPALPARARGRQQAHALGSAEQSTRLEAHPPQVQ